MASQYDFEKWEPERSARYPAVTIEANILRFDPEVAAKLKLKPESQVDLFFDRARSLIGIRMKRKAGIAGPRVKVWQRSWSIKAPKFFKYYGLSIKRRRFHCRWDKREKMLIIDLDSPVRPGRRNGE